MVFVDDPTMVKGIDDSYDKLESEAQEYPNVKGREKCKEAIRRDFNDVIKREVKRKTKIDNIPEDRKFNGSKCVFKKN